VVCFVERDIERFSIVSVHQAFLLRVPPGLGTGSNWAAILLVNLALRATRATSRKRGRAFELACFVSVTPSTRHLSSTLRSRRAAEQGRSRLASERLKNGCIVRYIFRNDCSDTSPFFLREEIPYRLLLVSSEACCMMTKRKKCAFPIEVRSEATPCGSYSTTKLHSGAQARP